MKAKYLLFLLLITAMLILLCTVYLVIKNKISTQKRLQNISQSNINKLMSSMEVYYLTEKINSNLRLIFLQLLAHHNGRQFKIAEAKKKIESAIIEMDKSLVIIKNSISDGFDIQGDSEKAEKLKQFGKIREKIDLFTGKIFKVISLPMDKSKVRDYALVLFENEIEPLFNEVDSAVIILKEWETEGFIKKTKVMGGDFDNNIKTVITALLSAILLLIITAWLFSRYFKAVEKETGNVLSEETKEITFVSSDDQELSDKS